MGAVETEGKNEKAKEYDKLMQNAEI